MHDGIVFSCCLGIPLHIIQVSGTIIGLKHKGSTHLYVYSGVCLVMSFFSARACSADQSGRKLDILVQQYGGKTLYIQQRNIMYCQNMLPIGILEDFPQINASQLVGVATPKCF